ncbi:MAG: DNA-binding protein [Panacagrimonas sp.]|jgi:GntR family transcriptional regulator/MocR family aminotransferase|nr:PLP-dependent aminotransferase family protein [Panacagrimonas sp.]MCC2657585.1 DNA-binding protein [Panacagrimonas sp.]
MPSKRRAAVPLLDSSKSWLQHRRAASPYYRQIYDRIRCAVASGALKPGERLPSARALMQETGLARGTIEAAYSLLAAEGYIQARGQAGTIVAPDLEPMRDVPWARSAHDSRSPSTTARSEPIRPFQMGLPALDAFPRKVWARLGARCVRTMPPSVMSHPSVPGVPELRAQIAAYLQVSRGIDCQPSQVFVTSGYRHSLLLVASALLKRGDRVWFEDPGYPPTRELLAQMGFIGVPTPVDDEGLIVQDGLRRARRARAAIVTPAHQSPLCVSLSLRRRQALLDWADRSNAWIVEDDYDGEYRYVGRPLPALKSLDRDERVIYLGTFSKVLFPALRLAYVVVPGSQAERFGKMAETLSGGCPDLSQLIVATFIREGHFARHIQRMRKLYAERREATADGLAAVLGRTFRIDSPPGGMHLILRSNGRPSDRQLAARMLKAGLFAEALTDWTVQPTRSHALLLSFTNVDSRAAAERLGRRMLQLL